MENVQSDKTGLVFRCGGICEQFPQLNYTKSPIDPRLEPLYEYDDKVTSRIPWSDIPLPKFTYARQKFDPATRESHTEHGRLKHPRDLSRSPEFGTSRKEHNRSHHKDYERIPPRIRSRERKASRSNSQSVATFPLKVTDEFRGRLQKISSSKPRGVDATKKCAKEKCPAYDESVKKPSDEYQPTEKKHCVWK